jgi:hypothetical protein
MRESQRDCNSRIVAVLARGSPVIYLAAPHRGVGRGRWDLTGPAATAKGVELEWAAPVLLIIP